MSRHFGERERPLPRSQRPFDRNGDGRLNQTEWWEWYYTVGGWELDNARQIRERRRADQLRYILLNEEWLYRRVQRCLQMYDNALLYVQQISDDDRSMEQSAAQMLLYQAMQGTLSHRYGWNARLPGEIVYTTYTTQILYQAFIKEHPEICTFEYIQNFMKIRAPLFQAEGILSAQQCGTFWQTLFQYLPLDLDLSDWESDIRRLLSVTAEFSLLFSSKEMPVISRIKPDSIKQEHMLIKAFRAHWQAYRQDAEKRKALARQRGTLPEYAVRGERKEEQFRFCQVRFPHLKRSYAYLTDDASITAGDRVLVPLGYQNTETPGVVEEVRLCTAAQAPYPPARTKHVLRKLAPEEIV